jgi:Protein of unknown function (DUF2786)
MSTRNREKRKAKKADRTRRQGRRPVTGGAGHAADPFDGMTPAEVIMALLTFALQAQCGGDEPAVRTYAAALAGHPDTSPEQVAVNKVLLESTGADVRAAWSRGWQPADLVRFAQRRLSPAAARLLVDVVAAEMRPYAANTVDARWAAQLESLGAAVWWSHDELLADLWCARDGLDRATVIAHIIEIRHLLQCTTGKIEQLCPLPGQARRGSLSSDRVGTYGGDQRMLDRVRALLAKAESTEFDEEAEALTAKAQELMARHSIDYALLAVGKSTEEPIGIRIGIDNPYETSKTLLLQKVAEANRCRAIWARGLGSSTVVGFPADVEGAELLYTSLLVQASTAMMRAGSRKDAYGRSRTRSFRQSFLDAFAIRIGQRLLAATEEVGVQAAAEEGSGRLLPVLAARTDKVRQTMESWFPNASFSAVKSGNAEGWASGTAAADLATIQARQAVGQATR